MSKGLKIVVGLVLITGFVACEKCQKPVQEENPFVNVEDRDAVRTNDDSNVVFGLRGGGEIDPTQTGGTVVGGGSGSDPNGDHGGIVDPDEDEDFDKDSDGK